MVVFVMGIDPLVSCRHVAGRMNGSGRLARKQESSECNIGRDSMRSGRRMSRSRSKRGVGSLPPDSSNRRKQRLTIAFRLSRVSQFHFHSAPADSPAFGKGLQEKRRRRRKGDGRKMNGEVSQEGE